MSSVELGGRDNFHSLCDFLNVSDGLEAALNFSKSSIICRVGDSRPKERQNWYRLRYGKVVSSRRGTYRKETTEPALRAGRAARESIVNEVTERTYKKEQSFQLGSVVSVVSRELTGR